MEIQSNQEESAGGGVGSVACSSSGSADYVNVASYRCKGPIGIITNWHHSYVVVRFEGTTYHFLCHGSCDGTEGRQERNPLVVPGNRNLENENIDNLAITASEFEKIKRLNCVNSDENTSQCPTGAHVDEKGVCGIIYLRNGVCHNIANRLLYALERSPVCLVKGCRLSYSFFGIWGKGFDTVLETVGIDKRSIITNEQFYHLICKLSRGY